jgi:NTE family protein
MSTNRRRIAIACQGGGSQCAFIGGALKTLLARGVQRRFDIVGLSGTSGGALTASVAWYGLLKQARGDTVPPEDRVMALWHDLTAQTPQEIAIDASCIQTMRLVERGVLPSFATSPSSPRFQLATKALSLLIGRPEFTDLHALIVKHLNFDELPSLIDADSPILLAGAGDVIDGTFKLFSSACGEITPEALRASAAIPTLFPAVWANGHAYWDGIFSSNPPVAGFLRKVFMGRHPMPQEIWIIQINRAHHGDVPETPADIFDRRNQLAGNLSLRHELEQIQMVNLLLREHAMTDEFMKRFGLQAAEQIEVRFIRMSPELAESLDYPSKLSRNPGHIARLIADGEVQAEVFLEALDQASDVPGSGAPARVESVEERGPAGTV